MMASETPLKIASTGEKKTNLMTAQFIITFF